MGKKPRVRQDSSGFDLVPDECSNTSKTSIGKKAAEKSGGLFSADDWMCKSCGNINWARRFVCNMCNAPKYQKNEARTGIGGGYNEREGVEYKERTESDDEYDEFGRIKKKFRASDRKPNELEDKKSSNDEDEDDDEEENVDLSKYKLDDSIDNDDDDNDDEDEDEEFDASKYDLTGDLSCNKRSRSDSDSRGKSCHSRSRSSSRRNKKDSSSRSRSKSRDRSSDRNHKRRSRSGSYRRKKYSRSRSRSRDRKSSRR